MSTASDLPDLFTHIRLDDKVWWRGVRVVSMVSLDTFGFDGFEFNRSDGRPHTKIWGGPVVEVYIDQDDQTTITQLLNKATTFKWSIESGNECLEVFVDEVLRTVSIDLRTDKPRYVHFGDSSVLLSDDPNSQAVADQLARVAKLRWAEMVLDLLVTTPHTDDMNGRILEVLGRPNDFWSMKKLPKGKGYGVVKGDDGILKFEIVDIKRPRPAHMIPEVIKVKLSEDN